MKEIKFRGKRKDNGKFIHGYYYKQISRDKLNADNPILIDAHLIRTTEDSEPFDNLFLALEVIPETVGQFIGLKDKNGVEIYEGDYLVDRFPINDEDLSEGYNESLLPVMWCNKKSCWCIDVTFAKNGERLEPIYSYFGDNLEVKGNIHTNQ